MLLIPLLLILLHRILLSQGYRVVFFHEWPKYKDSATTKQYLDDTLDMPVSTLTFQSPEPVFVLVDEAQTTKADRVCWNTFLKSYVQR